jgi:hypothetical protein
LTPPSAASHPHLKAVRTRYSALPGQRELSGARQRPRLRHSYVSQRSIADNHRSHRVGARTRMEKSHPLRDVPSDVIGVRFDMFEARRLVAECVLRRRSSSQNPGPLSLPLLPRSPAIPSTQAAPKNGACVGCAADVVSGAEYNRTVYSGKNVWRRASHA